MNSNSGGILNFSGKKNYQKKKLNETFAPTPKQCQCATAVGLKPVKIVDNRFLSVVAFDKSVYSSK